MFVKQVLIFLGDGKSYDWMTLTTGIPSHKVYFIQLSFCKRFKANIIHNASTVHQSAKRYFLPFCLAFPGPLTSLSDRICLSIPVSPIVHGLACLSVCLSVCPSLSLWPSVCPTVCLCVSLSILLYTRCPASLSVCPTPLPV